MPQENPREVERCARPPNPDPPVSEESEAWAQESARAYAEMAEGGIALHHVPPDEFETRRRAEDRIYPQDSRLLAEYSTGPGPPPTAELQDGPPSDRRKQSFRAYEVAGATSARDVSKAWEELVPPTSHDFVREIIGTWPLRPEVFGKYLGERYADAHFVCSGIRHGMPITDGQANIPPFRVPNAATATTGRYRDQVAETVATDVRNRWLNKSPPGWRSQWIHPITAAPKNREHPEKARVCQDQSRPIGKSVNDHQKFAHARWIHTDAISRAMRRDCYMMKLDVQFYYRNFGVYPPDWLYTACEWDGVQYLDTRVSFGLRNAPEMAQRVTAAVVWILHTMGHTGIIGLMDDFAVFAETPEECWKQFHALEAILLEMGFTTHPEGAEESKRSPEPRQWIVLSGILWDSRSLTASLDEGKVAKAIASVQSLKTNADRRKKDFQAAAGFLSWASTVVDGGRIFTQRIWRRMSSLRTGGHHARLTAEMHKDLDWWLVALAAIRHTAVPTLNADTRPVVRIATDAAGGGYTGVFWEGAFVYLPEARVRELVPEISPGPQHIQVWEAAAPLCAIRLFPDMARGHCIHCLTDNKGAEAALNKGSSHHDDTLPVIRAAFYATREMDCRIHVGWIPGKANPIADAISRLHEPGQKTRLGRLLRRESKEGRLPGATEPRLAWLQN